MVRTPVVAGQFYPGSGIQLKEEVASLLKPAKKKYSAIGIVSPHAGYMYSGSVAGCVFASINKIPRRGAVFNYENT